MNNDYCYPEEIYALFLEQKLDSETQKKFYDHLKACKKCLRVLSNLQRDLVILGKAELLRVPSEIYSRINEKYPVKNRPLKVFLKILKNRFQVIQHSFDSLEPLPALRFKGSHPQTGYLFKSKTFNMEIVQLKTHCNIILLFPTAKLRRISLLNPQGDILSSFSTGSDKTEISDLSPGKYLLTFDDNEIDININ